MGNVLKRTTQKNLFSGFCIKIEQNQQTDMPHVYNCAHAANICQ